MIYTFFDKKTSGGTVKSDIMSNYQLAEELRKSVITKFRKWKVYSSFIDSIWSADVEDIHLISKFN